MRKPKTPTVAVDTGSSGGDTTAISIMYGGKALAVFNLEDISKSHPERELRGALTEIMRATGRTPEDSAGLLCSVFRRVGITIDLDALIRSYRRNG